MNAGTQCLCKECVKSISLSQFCRFPCARPVFRVGEREVVVVVCPGVYKCGEGIVCGFMHTCQLSGHSHSSAVVNVFHESED